MLDDVYNKFRRMPDYISDVEGVVIIDEDLSLETSSCSTAKYIHANSNDSVFVSCRDVNVLILNPNTLFTKRHPGYHEDEVIRRCPPVALEDESVHTAITRGCMGARNIQLIKGRIKYSNDRYTGSWINEMIGSLVSEVIPYIDTNLRPTIERLYELFIYGHVLSTINRCTWGFGPTGHVPTINRCIGGFKLTDHVLQIIYKVIDDLFGELISESSMGYDGVIDEILEEPVRNSSRTSDGLEKFGCIKSTFGSIIRNCWPKDSIDISPIDPLRDEHVMNIVYQAVSKSTGKYRLYEDVSIYNKVFTDYGGSDDVVEHVNCYRGTTFPRVRDHLDALWYGQYSILGMTHRPSGYHTGEVRGYELTREQNDEVFKLFYDKDPIVFSQTSMNICLPGVRLKYDRVTAWTETDTNDRPVFAYMVNGERYAIINEDMSVIAESIVPNDVDIVTVDDHILSLTEPRDIRDYLDGIRRTDDQIRLVGWSRNVVDHFVTRIVRGRYRKPVIKSVISRSGDEKEIRIHKIPVGKVVSEDDHLEWPILALSLLFSRYYPDCIHTSMSHLGVQVDYDSPSWPLLYRAITSI